MDKLKSVLSGEEARRDDRNIIQQMNQASTLGWGTRIKGFIACFVVGAACTVLGVCVLFLPKIGITLFIVFYTFGNICALCSTMFLMGPMNQLKRMCDKTRALATTLMLVSWKNFGLALLFVILQVLSFTWYSLSYIPCVRSVDFAPFIQIFCINNQKKSGVQSLNVWFMFFTFQRSNHEDAGHVHEIGHVCLR
uniref:Vesicle transport protein n=1 Tax=Pundamilia nyererei TaxID=303518 RepID=A0A3B4G569_9CICH